jgi:hypothetical protein
MSTRKGRFRMRFVMRLRSLSTRLIKVTDWGAQILIGQLLLRKFKGQFWLGTRMHAWILLNNLNIINIVISIYYIKRIKSTVVNVKSVNCHWFIRRNA